MRVNISPVINGYQLGYDTDDVENFTFSTPRDVHEVPGPDKKHIERIIGQAHLHAHVSFKEGKIPTWEKA